MPIVQLGDQAIHYQRILRNPEIVAIHGLMSNLAFWFMGVLPHLEGLGMTAYDLRGHGRSSTPRMGYSTECMVRDLIALLDRLGIARANLVGHSFGGAVALHAAVSHPERVRSLVLADARVPSLQPPLRTPSPQQWQRLRHRLQRIGVELPQNIPRVSYVVFEELLRSMSSRSGAGGGSRMMGRWQQNRTTMKQWINLMQTTNAHRELQLEGGLTVAKIQQIEQPTLSIFGEHSNCMPTFNGLCRNIPNNQAVVVPGVGHLHPLSKPKIFSHHLTKFISSLPGE